MKTDNHQTESDKPGIYLGLGANIENPVGNIRKAIELLDKGPCEIIRKSHLYRTPPWGNVDQPDFFNMAVEIFWEGSPRELLEYCLEIEISLGRKREEHWGPRSIDLDILLIQDKVIHAPELVIPHPEIQHRAFVLFPLADIAGNMILPQTNKTILEWKNLLSQESTNEIVDLGNIDDYSVQ